MRVLLTSRALCSLLRGCSEENINTFGDHLCLQLEHGIAPFSPGGRDVCYKILALTQGLQQAFVRAVFANAPGCPGVAPPGIATDTRITSLRIFQLLNKLFLNKVVKIGAVYMLLVI